jgi:putative ABC transport system permease protein
MFMNYFKIMIRNLVKRKVFTTINLLGLASGMAICLLLALYIAGELGYDHYHERGDQIYRLAFERKYPGRSAFLGKIPHSIGQAVKMEFPEVLESTRVLNHSNDGKSIIRVGEKSFSDNKVFAADSNFFKVFTGKFMEGDVNTALEKPGTAVLSANTATRYFGSAKNAMGKEIIINDFQKCIISGVFEDWPEKSHLQPDIISTTSGEQYLNTPDYVYFGPYTYLLLNKNAKAAALEAKLPLIVDKYVAGTIEKLFGETYQQFIKEGNGYHYFLQSLKKIHLNSALEDEIRPGGSMRAILLFGAIAGFILFLACINFINLSTAISVERAREIGIRKTFGSDKKELIGQFLTESMLFSIASMVIGMLLAFLFVPVMNKISGNELSFSYYLQPLQLLMITGFSILVGIIAGLYPALVLSSFEPISVLKGRFKSNRQGIALRNGLVVFQFAVSVILIICTIVVSKQIKYVLGDSLGFRQDHIIRVEGLWYLRQQKDVVQSFVDEVSKTPGVEDITRSELPAGDDSGGGATWVALDNNASRTDKVLHVDDHYQEMLGLQTKEGRFFSSQFNTDSMAMVLNEAAVADFGLMNPVGARILSKDYSPGEGKGEYVFTVIGVIKDFHYQSLRKKIAPLVIINSNKFGWGSMGVRIKGDHFKTTIAAIEKKWKTFDAKHDFQFSFLDQNLAAQYKSEETEQKIFTFFSLLAILIASVGLFGLAAYSTLQRTKEISIRKVLGASPGNIILILSKDFLRLVIIASLVAFPLAGWAMYAWLQNFAYRIALSWWIFLSAGLLAAFIAIVTISYQAIKAAVANPVKSLKID